LEEPAEAGFASYGFARLKKACPSHRLSSLSARPKTRSAATACCHYGQFSGVLREEQQGED
jgi:hypothetical protein